MKMPALERDVFARVYAELVLKYDGSPVYIAHLAADAAEDAMMEARTRRNIRQLKQQRFRKHELLGLPERLPDDH